MSTHQVLSTGWAGECSEIGFEGSLDECNAYLAENGHQADYVRRTPGPTKAQKAQIVQSAARAALLASFDAVRGTK